MNVKDVNDNTPVFDPMSYSQEMWEDAKPRTIVLNVSATDVDSGEFLDTFVVFTVDGDVGT